MDWLVHLDADELLYLEGDGRGGASLGRHYAAATTAGLRLIRYVNHELLLPCSSKNPPLFKINPRLAAARLGSRGWAETTRHLAMSQEDTRPYFNGYLNGKSAVAVAAGIAAAGVHGWYLDHASSPAASCLLAGPSILHFHFSTVESFRRKYLAMAAAPREPRLFEPAPTEARALALIDALEGDRTDEETIALHIDRLHHSMTHFTESERALLEEAGLILQPDLKHAWTFES